MTNEIKINKSADNLAKFAYKFLLFCLILWFIVWVIASITNKSGWGIIAGFFMGLVTAGFISSIPGFMALNALVNGTQYRNKAMFTAIFGIGLTISVILMYVF